MSALEVTAGILLIGLGAALIALRERFGLQARETGHGVSPLAWAAIGIVLALFGASVALRALS